MTPGDALELTLEARPGAASARSLPVRIGFVNRGDESVRLLAEFEPLPVFFTFELVKDDGTPIALPGGGKVDFGVGRPRCVDLPAGETYVADADVGALLTEALEPGRYALSATYHNQYTEDCFRGVLRSNRIEVGVPPA